MVFPALMFTEADRLQVMASAKINVFLEVLGRRDSGYHDLCSVLVPVSVHDELTLEKTDGFIETVLSDEGSTDCEMLRACGSDSNLATRAAHAFKDVTGYQGGARIHLKKHVPVGGGLGGGSADAAAVLRGLNELWRTNVPRCELIAIASQMGCDVPALVHGGMVLVEGLGEKVTPVLPADLQSAEVGNHSPDGPPMPLQEWWLVLANPGFGVSTGDTYSRCSPPLTSAHLSARDMVCALRGGEIGEVAGCLFNGLQDAVLKKYPLIEMIAEALDAAGSVGTLLSGSGASVFGLARDEAHAHDIAGFLKKEPGCAVWCKVVRTLPDGVMVAHGPLEA